MVTSFILGMDDSLKMLPYDIPPADTIFTCITLEHGTFDFNEQPTDIGAFFSYYKNDRAIDLSNTEIILKGWDTDHTRAWWIIADNLDLDASNSFIIDEAEEGTEEGEGRLTCFRPDKIEPRACARGFSISSNQADQFRRARASRICCLRDGRPGISGAGSGCPHPGR